MSEEHNPKNILEKQDIIRTIWIDDAFENSLEKLAAAILKNPIVVKKATELSDLSNLLSEDNELIDYSEFQERLFENLQLKNVDELAEINKALRQHAAKLEGDASHIPSPTDDFDIKTANAICELFGINPEDRMGFEAGRAFINNKMVDGQSDIAIIVDMQNAIQGTELGAEAGLDILKAIYGRHGQEMVFVLTHETDVGHEAEKEAEIIGKLQFDNVQHRFPCVISKSRLSGAPDGDLQKALKVALKRSALRREVYRIGTAAQGVVSNAIKSARDIMCQIPPEDLEHAFVKRAIKEGVSDLHLIERLILGRSSKAVQQMFVDHKDMHERMRMLRTIEISQPIDNSNQLIEQLRLDEIWDQEAFLGESYAPLALGDIFETVSGEAKRSFILLGQPCDLIIREDGNRSTQSGDLVSFKFIDDDEAKESSVHTNRKTIDLRVGENGRYIQFDLRDSSPVQLDILDLATFRSDGRVFISSDQSPPEALLLGQVRCFKKSKKLLAAVASAHANKDRKPDPLRNAAAKCLLTLRHDRPFNSICMPTFSTTNGNTALNWNLKRTKRLRSPFVDLIVDQQIALLNRRAMNLDYLK